MEVILEYDFDACSFRLDLVSKLFLKTGAPANSVVLNAGNSSDSRALGYSIPASGGCF